MLDVAVRFLWNSHPPSRDPLTGDPRSMAESTLHLTETSFDNQTGQATTSS